MKALTAPFEVFHRHWALLWATTRSDVRGRFAGSLLGRLWLVFYPLIMLAMYATVYMYIFQVRFPHLSPVEYVLIVFCGLIPFIGFSEALGLGAPSVVANSRLIKNTLYPIELIPAKAVLVTQFTQVAGMAMLVIALGVAGKLTPWALLVVPIWICQLLFTLGVIYALSSVTVFIRDLQAAIPVVTLMLMIVSPIAYTPDMVPATMAPLLWVNPLSYMIQCYRDCLIDGRFPQYNSLPILAAFSLLTYLIGHAFFRRLKGAFADHV